MVCGDVPGGWCVVWVVCGDVPGGWCGWCVVMCLVCGVGGMW